MAAAPTAGLPTPIPNVRASEPTELRWMTEVGVREWGAIRHAALGERLVESLGTAEARATAIGVAYLGPNVLVRADVPLEHQTIRPQLRPLSLLDQLQAVADEAGWRCELSEKGQFALATADLFGGFEQLCTALRDDDVGRLLRGYLDGDKNAPGMRLAEKRRYFSFIDLQALGIGQPEKLVYDLGRARVITR